MTLWIQKPITQAPRPSGCHAITPKSRRNCPNGTPCAWASAIYTSSTPMRQWR